MTLNDFLNDWIDNYHKENVKRQIYVRYKSNIKNYVMTDLLGDMDYDKITRKDIDIRTLSEIPGRADPSITLAIYAHSSDDHKRSAMNAMHRL